MNDRIVATTTYTNGNTSEFSSPSQAFLPPMDVAIFYDPDVPEQGLYDVPEFADLLVQELGEKNLSAKILDSDELAEYMRTNPKGIMLISQGVFPGTIFQNRGEEDLVYSWLRNGGIGGFVGDYPFFYWDNLNNGTGNEGQENIFGVNVTWGAVATVRPTELGRKYIPSLSEAWNTNLPVNLAILEQHGLEFESYADDGVYADPIAYRTEDMAGWFINFHTACCDRDLLPPFDQMAREYAELISNRFASEELIISLDQPFNGTIVAQGEVVNILWTGSGRTALSVSLRIDDDEVWGNGGDVETWLASNQPVGGSYSWDTSTMPLGTYYIVAVIADRENEVYRTASIHIAEAADSPIAEFLVRLVPGQETIEVVFTDRSQNRPVTWWWDFGDGETSQQQNPTHTYNEPGDYRVSLTVANAAGADVKTTLMYVSDHPCANLLFSDVEIPYHRVVKEDEASSVVYLSVIGGDTPIPNTCGLNPTNDPAEWIGWGGPIDADNAAIGGQPGERHFIVIGGVLFERGIGTHGEAKFTFDLTGRNYLRFECYAGISDEEDSAPKVRSGENATCDFIFMVDGAVMTRTGILRGHLEVENVPPERVEFDIPPGAKELSINITDGGDGTSGDLACLGDARLIQPEPRLLSISSVDAPPGTSAIAELRIDDATGMTSGDIVVEYDANVITIDEVTATDLLSGMLLIPNIDVPGEIRLSMAGATGLLEGSGALVEIAFTVNADAEVGTETALSFGEARIYDEQGKAILAGLEDGVVKITHPGIKGDVNNDGAVRSNDATLALRIAAQLMIPTEYQHWAADMNDDGVVRANDATLILRTAAGLAAPGRDIIASAGGHITVMLSEAYGVAGERVSVPVRVGNANMLASGEICIAYDSAVLRAVDVLSESGALLVSNATEPGILRIAFASANRLNSQTIAEIQFDVLADSASLLKFRTVDLYGPDARLVNSRGIDKEFRPWAMIPKNNSLLQNFPNPFNPETWVPYQLAEDSEVTVRIYSATGQLIRKIDLGYKEAGSYVTRDAAAYWDGKSETGERVASGVYFYSIQAGGYGATRKMTVAQ